MAAIADCRIKFTLDLVHGHEVTAMGHFPVRAMAVLYRRLHFCLIGVAVAAERTLMAGAAEPVIRGGVETVILDKGRCMAESIKCLERAFLLILVTLGTTYLLTDG